MRISMLDMGERKYGDATYCEIGGRTILVDGAHRGDADATNGEFLSIPDQLKQLTGRSPPFHIDLLVVTHCHSDHIGCLPEMVRDKILDVKWALLADPRMGFGVPLDQPFPVVAKGPAERVAAALREEPLPPSASDDEIKELIDGASTLQQRYHEMLVALDASGTKLVQYGRDSHIVLEREFAPIGIKILGPTVDQLLICTYRIERERMRGADAAETECPDGLDEVSLYRALVDGQRTDAELEEEDGGTGAALNNQSIVLKAGNAPDAVLLTGDMQFASPGIGGLRQRMPELRRVVQNAGP